MIPDPGGFLARNLAALEARGDLAARLRLPCTHAHLDLAAAGGPVLRLGRAWVPLAVDPPDPLPEGDPVLVFGVGLGEGVRALLAAGRAVVAWDRDPALLRHLLSTADLAAPLREGRLELLFNADLLDHVPWRGPVLPHPVLAQVYRHEWFHVDRDPGTRPVLLCAGELFVDDLADALQARGFAPFTWEITRHAAEEIARCARRVAPELAVAVNYTHGLAELCTELGIPLACWEVDPATDQVRARGPVETARIFTFRRGNVEMYRTGGFGMVYHLPLATHPPRRHAPEPPEADPRYQAPVSFVGSSVAEQVPAFRERFHRCFREWRPGAEVAEAQGVLERVLALQRRDFSRYVVPEALDLMCPGLRAGCRDRGLVDPAALLGEIAAAEKRLNLLAPLGRHGLRVWGDPGWRLLEPHGVAWMGRAGHGAELNRIYAGSRVNVDIGRLYQPDIVTMRVFDVLACGGFVLAEQSDDLPALLEPGREVETWRTGEELVRKVAWYLDHPDEAEAIARRGQARVLRDHTVAARLETMLAGCGIMEGR